MKSDRPTRTEVIHVGLIGCGGIARSFHLPVLERMRGVKLAGAVDPNPEARARAARLTKAPVYGQAAELLRRMDIDAVVIAAPTPSHASLAVEAAGAGKHIYLEKPIATTAEEARRVKAAVEQAGVTAVVGYNRRFHPLFEQARSLLASGRIGHVRAVHSAFCESPSDSGLSEWRGTRASGGGVLLDLATHHIDLLRWILNGEVAEVAAATASETTEQDSAWLEIGMRGGTRCHGFFSYRAGLADYLEFIGERGTLRVDRHSPVLDLRERRRVRYGLRRVWLPPTPSGVAWRAWRTIRPGHDPSFSRSLRAFVNELRGRSSQLASLDDAMRSLEVALAAESAAEPALPSS